MPTKVSYLNRTDVSMYSSNPRDVAHALTLYRPPVNRCYSAHEINLELTAQGGRKIIPKYLQSQLFKWQIQESNMLDYREGGPYGAGATVLLWSSRRVGTAERSDLPREAQAIPAQTNQRQVLEMLSNFSFPHMKFPISLFKSGRLTLSCWRFTLYCLSCSSSRFRA